MTCNTNCYYVDSVNGSDDNPGTSPDQAWKTLEVVNAQNFSPGSVIYFKRGSKWNGGLLIDDSGTADQPIGFTTYGIGPNPIIENPGDVAHLSRGIIVHADWIIVEGFKIQNTQDAGIYINTDADHNIIQNLEITQTGIGITVRGQQNLITENNIHDLKMVFNTEGGDDDYGAIGFLLFNSDNEISYNRIINAKAASYDYGHDGGTIEFWSSDGIEVSNNYIHHNYAQGNKGFSEFGGREGVARDNIIAYNVMVDNDRPISIHMGGTYAIDVDGLRFENNTVVDTRSESTFTAVTITKGSPTPETLSIRNNIFWLTNYEKFTLQATNGFTHDHNLYYFENPETLINLTLGQGEIIIDPRFVDLDAFDLHLLPDSPAIDAGADLGYRNDFFGNQVPIGSQTDIGAIEHLQP
jgi:hypothetical protein